MADNTQEVLRGQVTLDLTPFQQGLDQLPAKVAAAATKLEAAFKQAATAADAPLTQVTQKTAAIATAFDGLASKATSFANALKKIGEAVTSAKLDSFGTVAQSLTKLGETADQVAPKLQTIATTATTIGKELPAAASGIKAVNDAMDKLGTKATTFANSLTKVSSTATDAAPILQQIAPFIVDVGAAAETANPALQAMALRMNAIAQGATTFAEAMGVATKIAVMAGTAFQEAASAVQGFGVRAQGAVAPVEGLDTQVAAGTERLMAFTAEAKAAATAVQQTGGSAQTAARQLTGFGQAQSSPQGAGPAGLKPSDSYLKETGQDLFTVTSRADEANKKLQEVEQSVYSIFRAGMQIAQLSFIFSLFGSAILGMYQKTISAADAFDLWARKATAAIAATGTLSVSVQQVEQALLDFGKSIGSFTPDEVAKAFYAWQSATGQTIASVSQLKDVLQNQLYPVLQASAIGVVDVQTAVRGVTSAVSEFGGGMDQVGHAAQVMLATAQQTNAEFGEMVQSFTYLGAGAHTLGLSIDEVAALLGRLSDVNLRGSQAGRALGQILASIVDPTSKATAAFDQLFGSSTALGGSWRDLIFPGGQFVGFLTKFDADGTKHAGLLELLAERTQNLSVAQRQQVLEAITTRNAYRALSPLVEDYVTQLKTTGTITDDATNKTQALYKTLSENPAELFASQWQTYAGSIKEQFGETLNALKEVLIQLGIAAEQAILPLVKAVAQLADGFRQLGEEHPQLVQTAFQLGVLGVVAGTLASTFGVFIGNLTSLIAAIKLVGPALNAMLVYLEEFGASIAGVLIPALAVVALLTLAWADDWDHLRTTVQSLGPVLHDSLAAAKAVLEDLIAAFKAFLALDFQGVATSLREAFLQVFAVILQWVAGLGPTLLALVRDFLHDVDGLLTQFGGSAYQQGKAWGQQLLSGLKDVFQAGLQGLLSTAQSTVGGIGTLVTGRAYGGYVQPGEVTLVGEQGPELAVLPPGTQIIPNRATRGLLARGMASGGTVPGGGGGGNFLTNIGSSIADFFGMGQSAGDQFNQGFDQAVANIQPPPAVPGPFLTWAQQMGVSLGDAFIQGFTSADFSEAESFLDPIKKYLDTLFNAGSFGSGSGAADAWLSQWVGAVNTVEQLVDRAKQGLAIGNDLTNQLTAAVGDLAPDIIKVANAWGQVQRDQGATKAEQATINDLNAKKDGLAAQKSAIQEQIQLLNQEKEPYQDQLAAIDKVIQAIQRQKQALEETKRPLEDQQFALESTVIALQHQLEPINDAKQALADQKQPLADQKAALADILQGYQDQKAALEDQKAPLQDQKDAQQAVLDTINAGIQALQDRLQGQKDAQQTAVDAVRATIDAEKDQQDQAKQAEADRHQAVQDRLDTESAALDLAKQQAQDASTAAQRQLQAEQDALDLTKARFAAEEQIAAAKVEQAGLLGASQNVTEFLKYQEAALKQAHQAVLSPQEAALKAQQDAEKQREQAVQDELTARERLLKQQEDAEKARQQVASRALDRVDRQLAQQERLLKLQQDADKAANQPLEDQIKGQQAQAKAQQARIDDTNKQLAAIDKQEKLLDRAARVYQQQEQAVDKQIAAIDKQVAGLDQQAAVINRQIDLANRQKSYVDDQVRLIDRQAALLDRQVQDQTDRKNAPNDAITALDDQITQQQRLEEPLDQQTRALDSQLKTHQQILLGLQDKQKLDEQALSDAEALLKWHEQIRDTINETRAKKDQQPLQAGDTPLPPDQPAKVPPGVDPNAPGSTPVTARDRALILATALWDSYLDKVRSTFARQRVLQSGAFGDLTSHLAAFAIAAARVFSSTPVTGFVSEIEKARLAFDDFVAGRTPEQLDRIAAGVKRGLTPEQARAFEPGRRQVVNVNAAGEASGLRLSERKVTEDVFGTVLKNLTLGGGGEEATATDTIARFLGQAVKGAVIELPKFLGGEVRAAFFGAFKTLVTSGFPVDVADIEHLFPPSKIAAGVRSAFTKAADGLRDLPAIFQKGVASGFEGVLGESGALSKIFDLGELAKGLGTLFKGLAGGEFLPIQVAIDAIILAVKNWSTVWDRITKSFTFVKDLVVKELGPVFKDFLSGTMERFGPAFTNILKVLGAVDEVIQVLIIAVAKFIDKLGPVLGPVIKVLVDIIGGFLGVLKDVWFILLDLVGLNFGKLGQDLKALFGDLWTTIKKLVPDLLSFFKNLVPALWEGLKAAFGFLLPLIGKLLVEGISGAWHAASKVAALEREKLVKFFKDWWQGLVKDATLFVKGLPDGVKLALFELFHLFQDVCGKIYDYLLGRSIIPDIVNGIVDWFTKLPDLLKDAFSALHDAFVTAWDALLGLAEDFVGDWTKDKAGLLGWLGWAFRGLVGLVATVIGLEATGTATLFGALGTGFGKILDWLQGVVGNWDQDKSGLLGWWGWGFRTLVGFVADVIGLEATGARTLFGAIGTGFTAIIGWFADHVFGDWDTDKAGLLGWFGWAFRGIRDNLVKGIGLEATGLATIWGVLGTGFGKILDWFRDTIFGTETSPGLLGRFKKGFDDLRTNVGNYIGTKAEDATSLFGALGGGLDTLRKWVEANIIGVYKSGGGGLLGAFYDLLDTIKSKVEDVIGKDDKSGIRGIFNTVADTIKTVTDKFAGLIKTIKEFQLPDWVKQLAQIAGFNIGGSPQGQPAPAQPAQTGQGGPHPIDDGWTVTQGPHDAFSHSQVNAVDLAAPEGTPVHAVGAGTAVTGYDADYGNYVDLTLADGNVFRYGHLASPGRAGAVAADEILGQIGLTGYTNGPHLHFEHVLGPGGTSAEGASDVWRWITGGTAYPENTPMIAGAPANGAPGTPVESVGQGVQAVSSDGSPLGQVKAWFVNWVRSLFGKGVTVAPGQAPNLAGIEPATYDPTVWGDPTADQLAALIAASENSNGSGTPLESLAGYIHDTAKALGVPLAVAATILHHESQFGTDGGSLNQYNNYTGLTGSGWPGQVGSTPSPPFAREFAIFDSPAAGVAAAIENMASKLYGGLTVTQFLATWLTGQPNGIKDEAGNSLDDYLKDFFSTSSALGVHVDPYSAIVHLQDGKWNVPYDGLPAVLHAGEMVVPADFARELRAAVSSTTVQAPDLSAQLRVALPALAAPVAAAVAAATTSVVEHHYHLHVDGTAKAVDPEDNRRLLERIAFLGGGTFRGNPGVS